MQKSRYLTSFFIILLIASFCVPFATAEIGEGIEFGDGILTPTPVTTTTLDPSWIYATLLLITLFLSTTALVIKDAFWNITLKVTAALFWFILAISQIFFFGVNSAYIVLSFPYAIFGLLFIVALIREILTAKHDRIFNFDRFD